MFFPYFTTTWMILRRDLLIFWLLHRNQLKPKKRRNKHWTLSPLRHPCFQSRFFLKIYPLSSLNLSPILCRLHRLWNALYPYPIKRTRTNQKIHLLLLLIKSSERQYILSFFFLTIEIFFCFFYIAISYSCILLFFSISSLGLFSSSWNQTIYNKFYSLFISFHKPIGGFCGKYYQYEDFSKTYYLW